MPQHQPYLPPKDVEPTEFFLKLMERPRPSEVIDFPRQEEDGSAIAQIRVQVLTTTEQKRGAKAALERCKTEMQLSKDDMSMSVVEEGLYGQTVAAELLAMACVGVEGHETEDGKTLYPFLFANGKMVEDAVPPGELGALFAAYTLIQKKFGPSAEDIVTEAELNAWIRRIIEGGSAVPLAFKDSGQLVDLLTLLISRVFVFSHILESLLPKLPPTLASRLKTWAIGTGYWSLPDEATTSEQDSSSDSNGDSPTFHDDEGLADEVPPVTIEQAIRLAREVTSG